MELVALGAELRGRFEHTAPMPTERDADSWDAVFAEEAPKLFRIGRARFDIALPDLEDALQNCALRIAESAPVLRNRRAYLQTAFLNSCRDLLRRRTFRRSHEIPVQADRADDPRTRVDAAIDVHRRLGGISPLCRSLLTAWICDEESAPTVADEHALSKVTIYRRLARCLRNLTDAIATIH